MFQSKKSSMKRSDIYGPGLLRAAPAGEESGVHRICLSSAPSADRSANPARAPGCNGLPECSLTSFRPGIVAELESLAPPSGISRAATSVFLPTLHVRASISSSQTTPEASLERLCSISRCLAAWKLLPNVSVGSCRL